MQPPRACHQSVVIPIEYVVSLSSGPPLEQCAQIGNAQQLGHWNSVHHSVVPPDKPSCEEKGSSEASHKPSHEEIVI